MPFLFSTCGQLWETPVAVQMWHRSRNCAHTQSMRRAKQVVTLISVVGGGQLLSLRLRAVHGLQRLMLGCQTCIFRLVGIHWLRRTFKRVKISETNRSEMTKFSGALRGGERDMQVGKNKAVSPISGTPCTSACHAIDTTTISVNAVHSVLTFSWNGYSFPDHGVGSLSALVELSSLSVHDRVGDRTWNCRVCRVNYQSLDKRFVQFAWANGKEGSAEHLRILTVSNQRRMLTEGQYGELCSISRNIFQTCEYAPMRFLMKNPNSSSSSSVTSPKTK